MKITLKAARVNAGFTQEEVAKLVQVSKATVVSWEKGAHSIPARYLMKLCELYGADPEFIILP